MRYLSLFSGIEAASVAWAPLGWEPFGFAEVEPAPCAVLSHRFPHVPNFGDVTKFKGWPDGAVDIVCGGSPCQSFSVAGLRAGMADPRGNLALTYLAVVDRYRPRWVVYENVPGLLSSDNGRDFGSFLGALAKLGYGFAYRVLDAQYVRVDGFGRAVPQRRRRVFVVGHLGDWRRPAAVLLERACLRGDPAPRRGPGEIAAASLTGSLGRRGGQPDGGDTEGHLIAGTLGGTGPGGGWRIGPDEAAAGQLIAAPFAPAISASNPYGDHESREGLLVAALTAGDRGISPDQACGNMIVPVSGTVSSKWAKGTGGPSGNECQNLVAFSCKDNGRDATDEGASPTLRAMGGALPNGGGQLAVARGWSVRRLLPVECERLQGFPDGWTAVPWRGGIMPDGPRYKALGNSMACNVMRWIGRRIEAVDALEISVRRVA